MTPFSELLNPLLFNRIHIAKLWRCRIDYSFATSVDTTIGQSSDVYLLTSALIISFVRSGSETNTQPKQK